MPSSIRMQTCLASFCMINLLYLKHPIICDIEIHNYLHLNFSFKFHMQG